MKQTLLVSALFTLVACSSGAAPVTTYFTGTVLSSTPQVLAASFYTADPGTTIAGSITLDSSILDTASTSSAGNSVLNGDMAILLQDATGSVNWSGTGQLILQSANELIPFDTVSGQIGTSDVDGTQYYLTMEVAYPAGTLIGINLGSALGSSLVPGYAGSFGFTTYYGPFGFQVLDFDVDAVTATAPSTPIPEGSSVFESLLGFAILLPSAEQLSILRRKLRNAG